MRGRTKLILYILRRSIKSTIKSYSTGYLLSVLPSIVKLLLKGKLQKTAILNILKSGFSSKMPLFLVCLLSGFQTIDDIIHLKHIQQIKGEEHPKLPKETTPFINTRAQLIHTKKKSFISNKKTFIISSITSFAAFTFVPKGKRSEIAIISLTRGLDSFFSHAISVKTPVSPRATSISAIQRIRKWISKFEHWDSVMFIVSCTEIMYSGFYL